MTLDSTDYDPRPADDHAAGLNEWVCPLFATEVDRLCSFPSFGFCPPITHCDQFGIPFAAFPHAF